MKITFLGTGSAYGVPTAGGDWGDCDSTNPKNKRLCQSILIECNDTTILVDIGPDFREQSIKHNIQKLDAIIITHAHYDHYFGFPDLTNFMKWQDKDLPIYAHKDVWEHIEKSMYWLFDGGCSVDYYSDHIFIPCEFEYAKEFKIGNVSLLPFKQYHGAMNSLGLRIDDFVYSPDLKSMPDESWDIVKGVDTWVLECDNMKPSKQHNDLQQAIEWVNKIKPNKTYLTHFDITMDHEKVSKAVPDGVECAYDGLVLEL